MAWQLTRQEKLRELLDMKQQQSGIIEAKAAIRRADESVVQGRSIVVFTVVTIFFVSQTPPHHLIPPRHDGLGLSHNPCWTKQTEPQI